MALNNLFLRLCKYCSEEAGSIDWSYEMIFPNLVIDIINCVAVYNGFHSSQTIDIKALILYSILSFSDIAIIICFYLLTRFNASYMITKLFAILHSLFFGICFYYLSIVMMSSASERYFIFNIYFSIPVFIILMLIIMFLMLYALKKGILTGVLSSLYNTRKFDADSKYSYDSKVFYYVAGISGTVFATFATKDFTTLIVGFLGGLMSVFSVYIAISSILSMIYYFIQIKHPELRYDE